MPKDITVIAGPCMAESPELMAKVCGFLKEICEDLSVDYYFKASFDKANRTSGTSYRGPGLEQGMEWFKSIKSEFGVKVLTDIHETKQVESVAEVCDGLQIPAFLCRQTDLLEAAVKTGRFVNIKKGQFLAPQAMHHIYEKGVSVRKDPAQVIALTERGASFGYGDLVVDPRSFPIMASSGAPVIFDVTHSTQRPAALGGVSGAARSMAPVLARVAAATGYVTGLFLEVHSDPSVAKSDAAAQLNFDQAESLLRTCVPLMRESRNHIESDKLYVDS